MRNRYMKGEKGVKKDKNRVTHGKRRNEKVENAMDRQERTNERRVGRIYFIEILIFQSILFYFSFL